MGRRIGVGKYSRHVRHCDRENYHFEKAGARSKHAMTCEDYSSEQAAWLRAIDGERRRLHRLPTLQEAFALAMRLGYRRDYGDSHNE